jgi:hypothetical protein
VEGREEKREGGEAGGRKGAVEGDWRSFIPKVKGTADWIGDVLEGAREER